MQEILFSCGAVSLQLSDFPTNISSHREMCELICVIAEENVNIDCLLGQLNSQLIKLQASPFELGEDDQPTRTLRHLTTTSRIN